MIISHKYKFIFIKTLKTAGTSIEIYLSQLCSENDIVTPILPHIDPHVPRNYRGLWNPLPEMIAKTGKGLRRDARDFFYLQKYYNHISARRLKRRVVSNVWDKYFKFCVERNPWDKTLSHYYMMNDITEGGISFTQYLEDRNFCLNYPLYTDDRGDLMVDKVVKYEQLNEGLSEVFDMLNVPFNGSLGVKAKSEHRVRRTSYKETLTEQQKSIIGNVFSKEILMHNYSLE